MGLQQIDPTSSVRTKGGNRAVIYTTWPLQEYCYHGAYFHPDMGWLPHAWDKFGRATNKKVFSKLDLTNVIVGGNGAKRA